MTSPTQKIPAGYKQTEIGVIPDDWDLLQLKNIAKYRRGSFPQPYGLDKWYDDTFGMPFIQVFDVANNMRLKADTKRKISRTAQPMSVFVKKGSIILTLQGSIGRIAITQYDAYVDRTLLLFENFLVPVDPRYFAYAIFVLFENEKQKAPGGIIKTITKEALSNFLLTLPPVSEQAAIADALSDIDALIEKLEKLIEKKKLIKQGAMQELLTGKRRLPGFSGEWEVKKLNSILKVKHGKNQKKIAVTNGKYPILATGGEIGRTNEYLYNKPSVLIGRKGTIDEPQYMDTPFWTVDTLFYTEIKEGNEAKFIFYKFQLIDWYSFNEASGVPSLNARTIENIEAYFPPFKEEQIAISLILSDMDIEIEKMELRLVKYQAIKQGMIQVLLTGKIRLINK